MNAESMRGICRWLRVARIAQSFARCDVGTLIVFRATRTC